MRHYIAVAALLVFIGMPVGHAAPAVWTEGKHYFRIEPARPTTVPAGKVEVTEVFSYGCPACAQFHPIEQRLKSSLPANALFDYLPASFNPSEDWPMFQRAYCTAQALGIADQTHDAMFAAVWGGGELSITDPSDPKQQRLKSRLPSIEDAARFYSRHTSVSADQFLAAAKSLGVDVKVNAAEGLVRAYHVDRTPTIIVNGKYRLHVESAGGVDQLIELVKWLVAKESGH
jgi:protein dithiol oxidoreductase (disulfide-forming)